MRKVKAKIGVILVMFLVLLGSSTVTAEASSYPIVFFCGDADFKQVVVTLTATAGDVVPIRMKWYAAYNNEGYEITVKDPNGNVVATGSRTWTNLTDTKNIMVEWNSKGYSAGVYTVEVKKTFYSFLQWRTAPTVERLRITLKEKPHEHTVVIDPAVAATCKSGGKTQGSHCSTCGQVIQPQVSTPVSDHKVAKWKTTKKATVLKKGERTGKCSVCKKTIKKSIEKLPATIKVRQNITVKKKKSATIKVKYSKGDSIKSWKTSNKKIATVSKKGKVTGKQKGTAVLTVKLKSGVTANVTVTVK